MQFALSAAPDRIADMTRPMAWQALRLGHSVQAASCHKISGLWRISMEDSQEEPPADPFLYGHTGLVEAARMGAHPGSSPWRVDWAPENFDRELWISQLGDAMWNHKARIMPLGEALASWTSGAMHLCPSGADSGAKAFKGFCCEFKDRRFQLAEASKGRALDPSMRVALSDPDAPSEEYRCVVIGGEMAASGRYLQGGRLDMAPTSPPEVEAFALGAARAWAPATLCVVDVGVKASRVAIVEFNGIHAAGFFALPRDAIVSGIANAWSHVPAPSRGAPGRQGRPS